ncbi:unnamed protein product [Darwinula stevensoni]|uniref:Anoctamin n=1 Tax=Darwinula stevensoni TaxID=69355 RepID=A0A7R9FQM8_9CRUS|nr:unnamed protein product [Darwinula stevensoni]CAG0899825.1 unnamed protein product [Darwinula stevensoni]
MEEEVPQVQDVLAEAKPHLRQKDPQSGSGVMSRKLWLRPVDLPEENCVVLITFPKGTAEGFVEWLRRAVRDVHPDLTLQPKLMASAKCMSLKCSAPFTLMLKGAEELCLPKKLNAECGGGQWEFVMSHSHLFDGIENPDTFFTSEETGSIVRHLLYSVQASETSLKDPPECVSRLSLFVGEPILAKCLSEGLIDQIFPLHEGIALKALCKNWVKAFFHRQILHDVKDYFGVKIGFYFRWLGLYTMFLLGPSIVGTILLVIGMCGKENMVDMAFLFYALFNVIWTTVFLETWKRKSAELAFKWGTLDQRSGRLCQPRPQFTGEVRRSPITGQKERYYPAWKRNLIRFTITGPMIVAALALSILTNSAICKMEEHVGSIEGTWGQWFLHHLPKVGLGILIPVYDALYYYLAVWLNDFENYRTEEKYENHLIFKLVVFQFVNSFSSLFYVAFYQQDLGSLQAHLAALLITRQIVDNVKESALPYFLGQFKLSRLHLSLKALGSPSPSKEKKNILQENESRIQATGTEKSSEDGTAQPNKPPSGKALSNAELESSMTPYPGTFDDYLEMFIQFGYVTLFSAAFPLAGLCAFLNNIVEIRSDAFKLCYIIQRPFGERVRNIGTWQDCMELMGLVAIVVNVTLIGQMGPLHRLAPSLSQHHALLAVVVFEHLLLGLRWFLVRAIPDVPSWVKDEMARLEFHRREAFNRQSLLEEDKILVSSIPGKHLGIQNPDSEDTSSLPHPSGKGNNLN